jgi:hypothetical protein
MLRSWGFDQAAEKEIGQAEVKVELKLNPNL